MPQTPLSAVTPYALALDLFVFHDPAQCADMLTNANDPRPSIASMVDITSVPGSRLYRMLKSASGKVETACLIGKRYTPADLQNLAVPPPGETETVVGYQTLLKLVSDLCFWQLCQRKQPNASDPKNVPGALEALEMLKALRDGEAIFSFTETAEAGLPSVVQAQPNSLLTPNAVRQAYRLFPNVYLNNLLSGGSANGTSGTGG